MILVAAAGCLILLFIAVMVWGHVLMPSVLIRYSPFYSQVVESAVRLQGKADFTNDDERVICERFEQADSGWVDAALSDLTLMDLQKAEFALQLLETQKSSAVILAVVERAGVDDAIGNACLFALLEMDYDGVNGGATKSMVKSKLTGMLLEDTKRANLKRKATIEMVRNLL